VKNPFYYSIATRLREDIFLSMLQPTSGDKILDIGCGLGYFTDLLSSDGAKCTGIDLDKKCIDYCQRNMRGQYLLENVTKMPFPDNSFDKILCTEILEHIQDNGKVLDEAVRVAKNRSILVASTPCSSGVFKGLFKRIGHGSVDGNSMEYHWHKGYTEDSLGKLLYRHGIGPVETKYTLVFWGEIYTAIAKTVVQALRLKKIDSQSNALEVMKTRAWEINVATFPSIYSAIKAEQPLSKYLKGHMIIMKGVVSK
jgi:SAM-dependent methyltransferase